MDIEFVVVRLLHIVSGALWVGAAVFLAFVLGPRVAALGPAVEGPVMGAIGRATGPVMGAAGAITILAGVYMALRLRWGSLDRWFDTGWGWARALGFVVSIAAMALGGATDAAVSKIAGISEGMAGRPPSPEEAAEMQRLSAQVRTLGRVAAVLVVIAVGSMASARFV